VAATTTDEGIITMRERCSVFFNTKIMYEYHPVIVRQRRRARLAAAAMIASKSTSV
jgi:hypothetical protein